MSPLASWRRTAVALWLVFLAAEAAVRLLDLYRRFPPVDIPSHALSGAALGATFLWLLGRRPVPGWTGLAVLGVALVAALWEAVEVIDEAVSPDPPHLYDRFLWDGALDLVVTAAAGALTVLVLVRRAREPERPPSDPA